MWRQAKRALWSSASRTLRRHGLLLVRPDFYSPMGNPAELQADQSRLWKESPEACLGVDFNEAVQRELLGVLSQLAEAYDYEQAGPEDSELDHFYDGNSQFSGTDARVLFALLRHWRPARIVEVGSGYSTLLMADVNRRFLGGGASITAIEPFPRPFLNRLGSRGVVNLLEKRVQNVDLSVFTRLEAGDVLFIDSSHVAKTGSDVNFLVFEVIPRLRAGVHVHFHDVFLPLEYPKDWVVAENRSWNELYLVRALLMFGGHALQVTFSSAFLFSKMHELPAPLAGPGLYGSSLWLTRGAQRGSYYGCPE